MDCSCNKNYWEIVASNGRQEFVQWTVVARWTLQDAEDKSLCNGL